MDDIITRSRDVSPVTGQPYVSLSVLQAAHWSGSLLRDKITTTPSSLVSPFASPSPSRDKDLDLAVTTADILTSLSTAVTSSTDGEKEKGYYRIPLDTSLRLGDSGGIEGTSMD